MVSKSTKKTIADVCVRTCFLLQKRLKCDDWIFALLSHLAEDFLKTTLKRGVIRAEEWPPSSHDVNALDYFYWDFVKTKVYEGRSEKPFVSEAELKKKK